jgi:hypothetical protein
MTFSSRQESSIASSTAGEVSQAAVDEGGDDGNVVFECAEDVARALLNEKVNGAVVGGR